MEKETIIQTVEGHLQELLAAHPSDFLVSVKVKPTNNIKIYLDADEGISIDKCIRYNRALYRILDESGMFPDGNFSLEVSSPGIDEPLKLHRQYKKNIGRTVEVTLLDGTQKTGKLLDVTETEISIEYTTGKGKKAETHQEPIPFDNIKSTIIQIQF
ncbi:ribosome maturation factor RimP [Aridibaculum aurantiacum]|uniref:ribosome maturation factor RimP n=1 Tax=Aridibaculum aurantiacum TaxID=2810307 RepID=UPI001A97C7F4|nr:ribosome maturation factor [Aridibaculum aurantiacum]